MRLSNWKTLLSGYFNGQPRRLRRRQAARKGTGVESLEARTLLTSTFFVDFGTAIPAAGMSSTVGEFLNIDGPGADGWGTGSNLVGRAGLESGDQLDYQALQYDFNGDSVIDVNDAIALQDAVLPIIERELAPFDIDVMAVGASSLLDATNSLQSNDTGMPGFDGYGENDVYSVVMELSSPAITTSGGSVGNAAGLFGVAARQDLYSGVGNAHDEATLTFADTIFSSTSGVAGTAEFNENLAHRLAYTIVHEGMHTYSLLHTKGLTTGEQMLSNGDAIRHGSGTRETDNIVTRFDLQLHGSSTMVNTYDVLAADADIGLRDTDRDGVPDFAYVTGTGAHDRITLTDLGGGVTSVQIDAYLDSEMTDLIRSDSYTITQGVDTEGLIVIDSSVNDDEVLVDAAVTANVMVRGGDGDDLIQGGSGNDRLFGEDGNDVIYGGAGHDVLFGQDGDDDLFGEAGNDRLMAHAGNDRLYGGTGYDGLLGGDGEDLLEGGSGSDFLDGGIGDDVLHGQLGNDVLVGGIGNDHLFGHAGNDWMFGLAGNDLIVGGLGNDRAWGDAGNDLIFGGQGNDQLDGGAGDDFLHGGSGNDRLRGRAGNDRLYGSSGHDVISGGAGNDLMSGGDGNDFLSGGSGNDRMYGNNGHDLMLGGAGNDLMSGGDGNDVLLGMSGRDVLLGGNGNDFLVGGPDADLLFGGPGLDLLLD